MSLRWARLRVSTWAYLYSPGMLNLSCLFHFSIDILTALLDGIIDHSIISSFFCLLVQILPHLLILLVAAHSNICTLGIGHKPRLVKIFLASVGWQRSIHLSSSTRWTSKEALLLSIIHRAWVLHLWFKVVCVTVFILINFFKIFNLGLKLHNCLMACYSFPSSFINISWLRRPGELGRKG